MDAALAVVFLAAAGLEYAFHGDDGYQAGPQWLNVAVSIAIALPVAVRRRRPVPALLVAYGAVVVPSLFVAHTLFFWSGILPLAVLLYTLARHRRGAVAGWALLAPWALLVTYGLHLPAFRTASNYLFGATVFGLAWLAGTGVRRLAAQRDALRVALAALARDQAAREQLAVLGERQRLAREMHDVVAHAVSVMLVQVGAARMALPPDPAGAGGPARGFLLGAEVTGRQAVADLRRLLELLRTEGEPAERRPRPGLQGLDTLVEQCRQAGLDVEVEIAGTPHPLPPGLDLAAYRIIQEALTNTLKHAGPGPARIALRYADPLVIEVSDDGPAAGHRPPGPGSGGHGLLGMRERAALFGGRLEAGRAGDGFRVIASLPLADPPVVAR